MVDVSKQSGIFIMKGLTLYFNLIRPAIKWATDEELARYVRMAVEAAENETIPTMESDRDKMLFEGFKECLKTGIEATNAKRNGVKNRWSKVKANDNFDTPSDVQPAIEKRSLQFNHDEELERLITNAIKNNTIGLDAVKTDIKRLIKEQYHDDSIVDDVFNKLIEEYNNKLKF